MSVMLRVADAVPAAVGVKVTLIEHEAPGARLDPQFDDWPKLAAFVPLSASVMPVRVVLPELVSVTV